MSNIITTKRRSYYFSRNESDYFNFNSYYYSFWREFIYPHLSYQEGYFQSNRGFLPTQSLGINSAKTPHQLGLERPDFLQRMTRLRDYKQKALQILIKGGIIFENEDGRVYMVEEKLDEHLRSKTIQTDGY